ncbi:nuclear fragile X mental retardation protein interacting protein 1 [Apophysomyces ossiformis]|uniref:Nuclear fragile X mental retardation protein interacting protein 1 n=1 Tax=Apophysomyces ossiformis TaxID=679940 RepID=A0A8H7BVE5_9FUNG|nr:nuclear fragile X mental retardation protein interacting protein 1 [Apophysomyces ossiformis]
MEHHLKHTKQPQNGNWGYVNTPGNQVYNQTQWQQSYYQRAWPQYAPTMPYDQSQQPYNPSYNVVAQPMAPEFQNQDASSIVYRLQQQTQQRQALGALAAASLTSTLNASRSHTNQRAPEINNRSMQSQRSLVAYDDLSQSTVPDQAQASGSYCCNRWYKSSTALVNHQKQHISCPDCEFVGVKYLVQQHEETEHGKPGKKRKPDGVVPSNAPKIDTPEELAAWIEARKRNWPSQANIERKKREAEEKAARGQLVPGVKRKHKQDQDTQNKKPCTENTENAAASVTPLGSIAAYESGSEKDDGSDSDSDASSGDSIDLEADAITSKDPTSSGKILLPENDVKKPKRICKYFARGKCGHGDSCRFAHEKIERPKREPKMPEVVFRKRPNLLRMLLDKEIRQEKNIVLQCFRYIVENDFLGEDTSPH